MARVFSLTNYYMHGNQTFGTTINCMDGRTQGPVSAWMKQKFGVDFVDTITEPGPDKLLAENNPEKVESIRGRVLISVNKHGSKFITIVAHHDCAGNPVSKDQHVEHVKKSVEFVKSWGLPVEVIGLWVGENWEVEEI